MHSVELLLSSLIFPEGKLSTLRLHNSRRERKCLVFFRRRRKRKCYDTCWKRRSENDQELGVKAFAYVEVLKSRIAAVDWK